MFCSPIGIQAIFLLYFTYTIVFVGERTSSRLSQKLSIMLNAVDELRTHVYKHNSCFQMHSQFSDYRCLKKAIQAFKHNHAQCTLKVLFLLLRLCTSVDNVLIVLYMAVGVHANITLLLLTAAVQVSTGQRTWWETEPFLIRLLLCCLSHNPAAAACRTQPIGC